MSCEKCNDKRTVLESDTRLGIIQVMPCPVCNANGQNPKRTDFSELLARCQSV